MLRTTKVRSSSPARKLRPPGRVNTAPGSGRSASVSTPSWTTSIICLSGGGKVEAWKRVGASAAVASSIDCAMWLRMAIVATDRGSEGVWNSGSKSESSPVGA